MVVDLSVLVRSFYCESRACYVGNPRESFFRVREREILFAKVSQKLDILNHYHCIASSGLPAPAARGLGVRHSLHR